MADPREPQRPQYPPRMTQIKVATTRNNLLVALLGMSAVPILPRSWPSSTVSGSTSCRSISSSTMACRSAWGLSSTSSLSCKLSISESGNSHGRQLMFPKQDPQHPGYAYPPRSDMGQPPQQMQPDPYRLPPPHQFPGYYAPPQHYPPPPAAAPRQRTAIACKYCRKRKVWRISLPKSRSLLTCTL